MYHICLFSYRKKMKDRPWKFFFKLYVGGEGGQSETNKIETRLF